ncbi:MAG: glycosyltransferase family 4 protein [Actinophytocola sp.]|uniref:glycosyltransferase family 4 protein n=1 Tax=Actinophytocola sp. TaxID=1872138 RepID=UPI003C739A90
MTTARGGAEDSVIELATNLARLVPAVEVIWWRRDGPPASDAGNAQVHEVASWSEYQHTLTRACSVERDRQMVVISSHRTVAADVTLVPHARVIPVVRHVVDAEQTLRVIDPASGDLVERTIANLPWELLVTVPVWVGISHASATALRHHAPRARHVVAIPNGVRIPAVVPARARPKTGRLLLLATVARTVPWKRLDTLVHAVADPRLRIATQLDVFGEPGSHQPDLERLVAELDAPVRFLGHVDDLPHQLAGYDLLVTAAVQEGFGRGVIDAAGVGVPALVPTAGASPELVIDGLTGRVYDPDKPAALVEALLEAALDRAPLVRMGRSARALADAWYTPGRCAAQYLELLLDRQATPLAAA